MHNIIKSIARQITSFSKKEIQKLFKISKYILRLPEFDIKFANTNSAVGKILIVTPKKIGNAPERNQTKRRIKAIFYQEKIYSYNYDFIIICKPGSINFSYQDIKNIFKDILIKLQPTQNDNK